MAYKNFVVAPTTSLPSLVRLHTYNNSELRQALNTIKMIFFPQPASLDDGGSIPVLKRTLARCEAVSQTGLTGRKKHLLRQESTRIPDSGYASAEEEDSKRKVQPGKTVEEGGEENEKREEDEDFALLRADDFERAFAIKWLTGFVKRADSWIAVHCENTDAVTARPPVMIGIEEETEEDVRMALIDEASILLARFAGEDDEQQQPGAALARQFAFPFCTLTSGIKYEHKKTASITEPITVELNDALLDAVDYTAVGLQSWASAIILAERMCADPRRYLLSTVTAQQRTELKKLRILELGAGTGLLSIATAKVCHRFGFPAYVKATDYHPMVLSNLKQNIRTNEGADREADVHVDVDALDWSNSPILAEEDKYDIVLAADVIYDPRHAYWIRDCVSRTMKRKGCADGCREVGSTFWLAIPQRSTGRHEGMGRTVEDAFPSFNSVECCEGEQKLVVMGREEVGKQEGVGRADEGGYTIFEIQWA